ncbi:hypothetical protein CBL_00679 [Carabus blaptoides fortunei]
MPSTPLCHLPFSITKTLQKCLMSYNSSAQVTPSPHWDLMSAEFHFFETNVEQTQTQQNANFREINNSRRVRLILGLLEKIEQMLQSMTMVLNHDLSAYNGAAMNISPMECEQWIGRTRVCSGRNGTVNACYFSERSHYNSRQCKLPLRLKEGPTLHVIQNQFHKNCLTPHYILPRSQNQLNQIKMP